MSEEKTRMAEAAILYYEKNMTQQQIARELNLSRQTVSKLLNDAVKEKIVEIKIHNPTKDREVLGGEICTAYGIDRCVVCGVSSDRQSLRRLMTVRTAVEYLLPLLKGGNKKIALSWGRTIQALIEEMPYLKTDGNVVFPLFGATEHETVFFSSNELARSMADKIGAGVKYAWFPYLPDSNQECEALKELSCCKRMRQLWGQTDLAIVRIGNAEIYRLFLDTFGETKNDIPVVGDVATHFFDDQGNLVYPYANTLCSGPEDIKHAKDTVAVAFGDDKVKAIDGALKTGMINTLITDEYTAKQLLGK